jgi:hypothetical protein
MSVDINELFNQLVSMASASGLFTQVNGHEPASPAQTGVTSAVWFDHVGPAKEVSGLSATAARVEFLQRLYLPIPSTGNRDLVDPALAGAAMTMIGLLSADFELGGEIFAVDLEGAYGAPLAGKAGYLDQGGGQWSRIIDITIPLVLDAVWAQGSGS